ncbi:MAG: zinc ribbon domain-containing protein [Acidobacteriia bacterium]|nr:zinc ribbon domain-containing protein [Terriglobia bacterium]
MTTSRSTTGLNLGKERAIETQTETVRVTGANTHGVIFRHSADLLVLDGRHCVCRSTSQPEIGSWVMVEFNHEMSQGKSDIVQGIVISNEPDGEAGESYQVALELETPQRMRVGPKREESQATVREPQELTVPVIKAESKEKFETAPSAAPPQPKPEANAQEHSDPFPNTVPVGVLASRDVVPNTSVEILTTLQETIKSAVAAEATRQSGVLKSWLSSELDKRSQSIASPATENTIREAVGRQISLNYQTAIQTINSDLVRQLGTWITKNTEVQTYLKSMAKNLFNEQTELFQASLVKISLTTLEEILRGITFEECNGLLCSKCSREMAQTFLYCPYCGTQQCATDVPDPIPVDAGRLWLGEPKLRS